MTLYKSEKERKLHTNAINSIAHQYHLEEPEVRNIYEAELDKLNDSAHIRNFLPVLTVRHVKEKLHGNHNSS